MPGMCSLQALVVASVQLPWLCFPIEVTRWLLPLAVLNCTPICSTWVLLRLLNAGNYNKKLPCSLLNVGRARSTQLAVRYLHQLSRLLLHMGRLRRVVWLAEQMSQRLCFRSFFDMSRCGA